MAAKGVKTRSVRREHAGGLAQEPAHIRPVGARLHFVGGGTIEVTQGAAIATSRLEAASEQSKPFASLTEPHGRAAFVNPHAITYIEQVADPRGHSGSARVPNSLIAFMGGTQLEIVQGSSIANKRLDESCEAAGLFAALNDVTGRSVFVNHTAVTHIMAEVPGVPGPDRAGRADAES